MTWNNSRKFLFSVLAESMNSDMIEDLNLRVEQYIFRIRGHMPMLVKNLKFPKFWSWHLWPLPPLKSWCWDHLKGSRPKRSFLMFCHTPPHNFSRVQDSHYDSNIPPMSTEAHFNFLIWRNNFSRHKYSW